MSHVPKYRKIVVDSHWSIVYGLWLLVGGGSSLVNRLLSLVVGRWLGAADAGFDCFGANAWPLRGESVKICYQMHENKPFGSINCR